MNTQMYTDFAVQTAQSKPRPTKRNETTDETSFSSELKRRLDEAKQPGSSAENGIDAEERTDSSDSLQNEQPVTDEADENEQQTDAAMQIVSIFAMMPVPIPDIPVQTQTEHPPQQVPSDTTANMSAISNTVPVVQEALQQAGEAAPSQQSVESNGQISVQHASSNKSNADTVQDSSVMTVENTQSTEHEFGTKQGKHSGSDAESPMASENTKTAQKPEAQSKTQPDTGQLNAFAQRLDKAGLTMQTVAAKEQPNMPPSAQVATAVMDAYSSGKTEFTMRLQPEALGELTVKLVYEQGTVSLSILTANDHATKLINTQMAELKTALKENNIQLETCSVENQAFNNLASGGQFSMLGGRQQQRPEHTQRFTIRSMPIVVENSISPVKVLGSTSILNCYV